MSLGHTGGGDQLTVGCLSLKLRAGLMAERSPTPARERDSLAGWDNSPPADG